MSDDKPKYVVSTNLEVPAGVHEFETDDLADKSPADDPIKRVIYIDDRVIALTEHNVIDESTVQLSFEKPKGFLHQKGQHVILDLRNPQEMELDLPYRWLQVESNGSDDHLSFQIKRDGSSFSKSCENIDIGETAVVYGPMA